MESPLSAFFRMRWDHEPRFESSADCPVCRFAGCYLLDARRVRSLNLFHAPPTGSRRYCRLAACATSTVHGEPSFASRTHWDHEPPGKIQSAAGAAHSKTWRKFGCPRPTRQRRRVRRSSAAFERSALGRRTVHGKPPLSPSKGPTTDRPPWRQASCLACSGALQSTGKPRSTLCTQMRNGMIEQEANSPGPGRSP